jgi:hypothetical protein
MVRIHLPPGGESAANSEIGSTQEIVSPCRPAGRDDPILVVFRLKSPVPADLDSVRCWDLEHLHNPHLRSPQDASGGQSDVQGELLRKYNIIGLLYYIYSLT